MKNVYTDKHIFSHIAHQISFHEKKITFCKSME